MNVKNIINKNKVPTFSVSYFSKASPENSYSYCLQFLSAQPLLKSFQVTEVTTFSQQSISDLRQCLQWPPYCWILWFSCCSFQNSFIIWLQNHHTLLVFPLWHCFFNSFLLLSGPLGVTPGWCLFSSCNNAFSDLL